MEDMEQYLSKVKGVQQESIQRIETLESQKNKLQGNVVIKEKEKEEVSNNTVFFLLKGKWQSNISLSYLKDFQMITNTVVYNYMKTNNNCTLYYTVSVIIHFQTGFEITFKNVPNFVGCFFVALNSCRPFSKFMSKFSIHARVYLETGPAFVTSLFAPLYNYDVKCTKSHACTYLVIFGRK